MTKNISFGTDGWRGILAEDFTFDNVRLVARAVAQYILAHRLDAAGVVVGYDNRFLSERFASEIAEVLSARGICVYLTGRATPTPAVAFAVKLHNAGGGGHAHRQPQPAGIQRL